MAYSISLQYKVIDDASKILQKIGTQAGGVAENIQRQFSNINLSGSVLADGSIVAGTVNISKKIGFMSRAATAFKERLFKIAPGLRGIGAEAERMRMSISAAFAQTARLRQAGDSISGVGKKMSAFVTLPILGAGIASLKSAGEFEQMEIAYGTMLGSAEKGKKMLQDLAEFSAATPFQLPGIAAAARQLIAVNVPAEEVTKNLTVLGNIAAGTAQPIEEIAAIYSKIMAKGKAQAEELNQFNERGISILDTLREGLRLSSNQDVLDAASKGLISADIMKKALDRLGGEGGKFYGLMDKQSLSLLGLFSTVKDNLNLFSASVGKVIVDMFGLKDVMVSFIDGLKRVSNWFGELAKNSPGQAKLLVWAFLSLAIIGPGLLAIGFAAKFVVSAFIGWRIIFNIFRSLIGGIIKGIVWLWTWIFTSKKAAETSEKAIRKSVWAQIKSFTILTWSAIKNAAIVSATTIATWARMSARAIASAAVMTASVIGSFVRMAAGAIASAAAMAGSVIASFVAMSAAFFATPFGLVLIAIAAIAGIAYLLYDNWNSIIAWFKDAWQSVCDFFDQLGLVQFFVNIFGGIIAFVSSIDLYEIGINIIASLLEGIVESFKTVIAFINKIGGWIASAFGIDAFKIDVSAVQSTIVEAKRLRETDRNAGAGIAETDYDTLARQGKLSGVLDVNINLAGNTQVVKSVDTRALSKGNLGFNLARSGRGL